MSREDAVRSEAQLEEALYAVAPRIAYPETPDLASAVARRLQMSRRPPVVVTAGTWSLPWRQPLLITAASLVAVLMVAVLLALLLPGVRASLADRLGIPGLQIVLLDQPAPTVGPDLAMHLRLGEEISLTEAVQTAPFALVSPNVSAIEEPDRIYRGGFGNDRVFTFLYSPGDVFPPTSEPEIGALLMQFSGSINGDFLRKGVYAEDPTQRGRVIAVEIDGKRGFWVEGHSHFFAYLGPSGQIREDTYRLSANALVWEQDGRSLRLETALPVEEAIAIATTIRPIEARP